MPRKRRIFFPSEVAHLTGISLAYINKVARLRKIGECGSVGGQRAFLLSDLRKLDEILGRNLPELAKKEYGL